MRGRNREFIACENAALGCRVTYCARDMRKHTPHCLYQYVNCDVCDKSLLLRDLVFHQKIKQCHETKIKRERIQHSKQVHNEVMTHFRALHSASTSRQNAHRRYFRDKVHKKIGWTPPVPSVWYPDTRTLTPNLRSQMSRQQIELGLDLGRLAELTPIEGDRLEMILPMLTDRGQFYQQDGNEDELMFIPDQQAPPGSARTASEGPSVCMRCSKLFRPSRNSYSACSWHKGPVLKTYRFCSACGQLSHRPGCCIGSHIALEM